MKEVIKMYRHTVRITEHLPPHLGDKPLVFYQQGDWSSVKSYIPGTDKAVVLIEEKEIEIDPEKFDRRKKTSKE